MSLFAPAPEPKTELGRLRILSKHAGIRVSPLCLGAMSVGEAWKEFMGSMDKEQAFKLLDAFVEAGGNFIDTANNYQNDDSEKWLGEWMKERGNRDQIVLATKFTTQYKAYTAGAGGHSANYSGNHKKSLHLSLRDSLAKLQTDYVDILYLHWWDWTTSIKEVMDAVHVMVEQGKVLYLGISDTPAWVVSAMQTYALEAHKTPVSIYQGRWNIMLRDFEREIIPMCRNFGIALAPWDVLGGGKFQSKKAMDERKRNNEGLRSILGPGEQTPQEVEISEALSKVAAEHGIESVTTIALAYVRAKVPNVFPIIGGRKIEHLHDNIKSLDIKLTTKQVEFLESHTQFDVGFPLNFINQDSHITGKTAPLVAATAHLQFEVDQPFGLAREEAK